MRQIVPGFEIEVPRSPSVTYPVLLVFWKKVSNPLLFQLTEVIDITGMPTEPSPPKYISPSLLKDKPARV
jgi:hypothetical protein